MPVQYQTGIIQEHRTVRQSCGVFDVSHMGFVFVRGKEAKPFIQKLITNDINRISPRKALYTVLCLPTGGTIDDCIVYCRSPTEYAFVVNASNTAKDIAWMREHATPDVTIVDASEETSLIAVQGPQALQILCNSSSTDLTQVARFQFVDCSIAGVPCMAARTGYTGEDGFELACAAEHCVPLWESLLDQSTPTQPILPIGLGARNTLRLEARYCLYGNDLDETTTPYEAGLGWVVKLDASDFIGKQALVEQKRTGVQRKLIGFTIRARAIARPGYPILLNDPHSKQTILGTVTSGTGGISVPGAIGLGYVPSQYATQGQSVAIDCRGKKVPATITKGPFYTREEQS